LPVVDGWWPTRGVSGLDHPPELAVDEA
jgi:hypothetical protein